MVIPMNNKQITKPFTLYLKSQRVSNITLRNYSSDINHFLDWFNSPLSDPYKIAQSITEEALKKYQTRFALESMKNADKLGSIDEPVRLMFLKFLVAQDQHQGLWNIVNVIGPEFYVVNDLDKKTDPVWVKLSNERSTNFNWQLTIVSLRKK